MHFLYKWEWNWNSVNQNSLWCSAGTMKQAILKENSNNWEGNRNFNVLLFVHFKFTFADFLFFVSKLFIHTVHFWHMWLDCDHRPYLMSSLDKWKSRPFHPHFLFLCMERTGSSMELFNWFIFWTPGFGLSSVWGNELVQCVATDYLQFSLGNWTGTVCGNRLLTVQFGELNWYCVWQQTAYSSVWGTELVQRVATDCLQFSLGNWTGTVCGNRLLTVQFGELNWYSVWQQTAYTTTLISGTNPLGYNCTYF